MTTSQKLVLALAVVFVAGAAPLLTPEQAERTREEQLASACDAHPEDCEKMKLVHLETDAVVRELQTGGPSKALAVASLMQVQQQYDDRFIATGYYGEAKPMGKSVTVRLPLQ